MRFSPGFPASIRIPVKQGTKSENLGTAELLFTISAPEKVSAFTFTAEDLKKKKKADGISVTLRQLGDHNASISYQGATDVIVLAADETGKYLKRSSWSRSGNNSSTSFRGHVKTVHVIAANTPEPLTFKKTVDLNKGERLQLQREPTDTPIVRHTTDPMETAVPISLDVLKSLKVEWSDAKHSPGGLRIKYPVSPRAAEVKWRACFFSTDKPYLSPAYGGWSGSGPAELTYVAKDSKEAGINGAFGSVAIKAPSSVVTLTAARPASTEPVSLKTPLGTEVTVSFDKNTATVTAPSYDQVLDIQAKDAEGNTLKEDYGSSHGKSKTTRFWGIPAKLTILFADGYSEHLIPFELEAEGLNKDAFNAFKTQITNLKPVMDAYITAVKAQQRVHFNKYDGTIAGLYYLHGAGDKASALIPIEMAHSDPAAAERYGYEVKPYLGYTFTTAKGFMQKDKKSEYRKMNSTETLKWDKGEFQVTPYAQPPAIIATPVDKTAPTIISSWGQPKVKFLGETVLDYQPGHRAKGWSEWKELPGSGSD